VAGQGQLREAALLDSVHANGSACRRTSDDLRIAPQRLIGDNRRQAINVDDVVDFWLSWDSH
jgi:hypothetical protein